jgi:hypothetical protein
LGLVPEQLWVQEAPPLLLEQVQEQGRNQGLPLLGSS